MSAKSSACAIPVACPVSSRVARKSAAHDADDPLSAVSQWSSSCCVRGSTAPDRARDQIRTVIGSNPRTQSPPAGLPAIAPIVPRICGGHARWSSDS
eukprot:8914914-Pyramimonas_sp.AAC.2